MRDLVEYLIQHLVDDMSDVTIVEEDKGSQIEITVTLPQSQMGKVIGKQGKIAKSIRTVLKSASYKSGKKYSLEICEK
ncbi:MAG: KH domain-containing protein [Clostridia bacterium]|nr:KH domain-containing protein [Clostridia bacterium]